MAEGAIKGLSLDLGLDTAGIDTGLKGLKSKLSGVNSEMKNNMSAFDRSEKSVKKYETQLTGLNKKLDLQKAAVSAAKREHEEMIKTHGAGSKEALKAEKAYNDQSASLKNLERYVGSVKDEMKAFQKEQDIANSRFGKLSKTLDAQGDKFQAFGGKMTKVGGTMTKVSAGIIAGVAGIGVGLFALTSRAAEAGDEIAKNATKLGVTTDFYQEMDYWAGQNGVSHADMEKSMKRLNQRIGEARNGNEKYIDALKRLGVDMGALEDGTLTTEDAMAKSISTLSEMTNESDKSALAAELFGKKLGQELMPALQDGSLTMEEARKKAEELGIVIGQDQLEAAEDFQDAQDDMKRSMGMIATSIGLDLMPMFQTMTEYITKNLPKIKEVIADTFDSAVEKVTNVVTWFKELSPAAQKGVMAFTGLALALGPILMVAGKFIFIIGGIMKALAPVSMAIAKAGGLMKVLGLAFGALVSPVAIVIGVIALLTAGFVIAYKKSETFRDFIHSLGDKFKEVFGNIKEFIPVLVDKMKEVFGKIKEFIQPGIDAVIGFFDSMKEKITGFISGEGAQLTEAFQNIGVFIGTVVGGIWLAVKFAFDKILSVIEFIMPAVMFIIDMVWGNIKGLITGALDVIMGAVKVFSGLFTGDFSKMWEGVKQMFFGAINVVWNYINLLFVGRILKGIGGFVGMFGKALGGMWTFVKGLFTKSISAVFNTTRSGFTSILNTIKSILTAVKNTVSNIWNGILNVIKSIISNIWNSIKTTFTNILNTVRSILTTLKASITSIWNGILNTIKSVVSNIWNAVKATFTTLKNGVVSLTSSARTGIINQWTRIKSSVTDLASGMWTAVKKTFDNMVTGAKELPGKIGEGIKNAASKATGAVKNMGTGMLNALSKPVNGMITGINWVTGKLGIKKEIGPVSFAPAYAKGTDGHPGGDFIAGEEGRELVKLPNGESFVTPDKATFYPNMPKGTHVIPNKATEDILKFDIPHFAKGTKGWLGKIGDVWDYVKNPSKIMNKLLDGLGIGKVKGFTKDLAGAGWEFLKTKPVEYIKGMFGKAEEDGLAPGSGKPAFNWPVTSGFGYRRHPIFGTQRLHAGTDYGAPSGSPIPSTTGGKVSFAGMAGGFGNLVKVKNGMMEMFYAHMSKIMVSRGQSVKKGDTLGLVGSTGNSTGPHLHYETHKNGKAINPMSIKGFANGGLIKKQQLAMVGEGGYEEVIIPTGDPRKRTNAMKLLALAGKKLGVDGGSVSPSSLPNVSSGDSEELSLLRKQVELLTELVLSSRNIEAKPVLSEGDINRSYNKMDAQQSSKHGVFAGRPGGI